MFCCQESSHVSKLSVGSPPHPGLVVVEVMVDLFVADEVYEKVDEALVIL